MRSALVLRKIHFLLRLRRVWPLCFTRAVSGMLNGWLGTSLACMADISTPHTRGNAHSSLIPSFTHSLTHSRITSEILWSTGGSSWNCDDIWPSGRRNAYQRRRVPEHGATHCRTASLHGGVASFALSSFDFLICCACRYAAFLPETNTHRITVFPPLSRLNPLRSFGLLGVSRLAICVAIM